MTEYRYPCPHCEGELIINLDGDRGLESVNHSQTIKLQVKV